MIERLHYNTVYYVHYNTVAYNTVNVQYYDMIERYYIMNYYSMIERYDWTIWYWITLWHALHMLCMVRDWMIVSQWKRELKEDHWMEWKQDEYHLGLGTTSLSASSLSSTKWPACRSGCSGSRTLSGATSVESGPWSDTKRLTPSSTSTELVGIGGCG